MPQLPGAGVRRLCQAYGAAVPGVEGLRVGHQSWDLGEWVGDVSCNGPFGSQVPVIAGLLFMGGHRVLSERDTLPARDRSCAGS